MNIQILKKHHVKFIQASEMNKEIYGHKLYIAYKERDEFKCNWTIYGCPANEIKLEPP